MRKLLVLIVLIGFLKPFSAKAQPGDTITVQTFTFGSPQDAWFVFPSDTVQVEKILMKYTLKCNPAQSPACGEWDYLTYTYLYDHTGLLDSTKIIQPIFTVNGSTPSSYPYMLTPSYSYSPYWQYGITHTDTTSLNISTIGSGISPSNRPFGTSAPVSRTQFLWKASEMTSAGLTAGNITGLQFYLQSLGSSMNELTIRIKSTSLDSLTNLNFDGTGFTTVFSQNKSFSTTGWNSIQLTNAFNWDGVSNLIIEITYENSSNGTDNVVDAGLTTFSSGISSAGADRSAAFHSYGYVDIPMNNELESIDSALTITMWTYGSPQYQPMDGTCFEAVDSLGNRVWNTHLPWSDSNVYWDAGNNGGYDRINKAATVSEIEGQWNHWAFTKNVATGSMKIYLNGTLWHSGTGKVKPMVNANRFRIGKGNWGGSQTYEGKIDEFAVFNTELSASTILDYARKPIDVTHPNHANLVAYYQCNDGNYSTFADAAPTGNSPAVLNGVDNPLKSPLDLVSGFSQTNLRPNIKFEQGVFTSVIDSTLLIDSVMNAPVQIIMYADSVNNPGMATDTLTVWPIYYNNYTYNSSGVATDSSLVAPNDTLTMVYYVWYNKFPQVIRYELGRYITPYGIGLSLGTGWTWTFDVSDYRTLLTDSVHLTAGNWQELLDLKFEFITGTPPRDIISIQNLWNGGFNYGQPADPIESHLTPKSVYIPSSASTARWKSRVTGHGMDTPENCAEFCPKFHYYKVDGVQQFSKLVWRDNCDVNPLYPQGGTWVYDRSNWCPGAEVWTYDWEITPYITPGDSVVLDHDAQPYTSTGGWDYYQIEDQLVTYGAPNFTLDAAIEDILSPSANQMWARMNPVCANPVIRIKNTGSTPLTSVTITYGLNGATPSTYVWTGTLNFLESTTVTLESFNWAFGATNFTVTLSNPNGGVDEYAYNNTMTSKFNYPFVMPSPFFVEFRSNLYYWEDSYEIRDASGTVLLSRSASAANTTYKDTLFLPTGCYEFEFTDTGEDGLSWWANTAQGTGFVRFKNASTGSMLKTFNADFGGKIYMQFTVGLTSETEEYINTDKTIFNVYPNPTNGQIYIDMEFDQKKDASIEIRDVFGNLVFKQSIKDKTVEALSANLSGQSTGVYFVNLVTNGEVMTKKIILQK